MKEGRAHGAVPGASEAAGGRVPSPHPWGRGSVREKG